MDKEPVFRTQLSRREVLTGSALLLVGASASRAEIITGHLPWAPNAGNPPLPAAAGPWLFFSGAEARTVEAIADRIIPPDPQTPGGKDSGCAVFIDRQLAGPYGRQEGPLRPAAVPKRVQPNQGPQSEGGPAQEYREGLAALDRACQARKRGKAFADLTDERTRMPVAERTSRAAISSSTGPTERPSSSRRSRTSRWASSPIRFMAAIATWSPGR